MTVTLTRRTISLDTNGDPTVTTTTATLTLRPQDWQPYSSEKLQVLSSSVQAKQWRIMFIDPSTSIDLDDTVTAESKTWHVFEIRKYEKHTEVVLYEQS